MILLGLLELVSVSADSQIVTIVYRNWKGVTAERRILPIEVWYGSTEYHADSQWLLRALDTVKGEERNFAMQDIQKWGKDYVSQ